jgi:hypothetical protein
MRTTLLIATIVAALGLAACSSGGGSQAIPGGGSQASAPMNLHGYHIIFLKQGDVKPDKGCLQTCGCPSYWQVCYKIAYGTPLNYPICVGLYKSCLKHFSFTWSQTLYTLVNHVKSFRILSSFYPNPGNPTTVTANERFLIKASRIGVKYTSQVTACLVSSASNCVTANVGLWPIAGSGQ